MTKLSTCKIGESILGEKRLPARVRDRAAHSVQRCLHFEISRQSEKRKTLNQNKVWLHLDNYVGLWLLRETFAHFQLYSFYSGLGSLL